MRLKLYTLFIVLFSLLVFEGHAQDKVVRGRIVELSTKEPVPGATIVEVDENDRVISGTITDINGDYAIKVSGENAHLKYSFIGFKSVTENVGNRSIINIEFESSAVELEDIVISAKATDSFTGVNERDRATSVAKIDMAEMRDVSVTSAADALQGQISGLDIVSSGAPGGASQIVIRGLGSLGDSKPLIVVDGIAQNVSGSSNFDFASSDVEDLSELVSIAPQDIKSIEVLKDAASTAIWGSQGADGVLMITTNRGAKGKTRFDYNYKLTINQAPPAIPMLNGNEYSMLMLEELHNAEGIFEIPPEIAYDQDFYDFYNYSANTDWVKEITQTGFSQEHFFKVSGGGDKALYYVSLNSSNETGTTVNEGFKRLTTRINLDYHLSKKLKFSVNFAYTNSYRDGNWSTREDINGDGKSDKITVRRMAYVKAPNMSVYERDQFGKLTGEYFTPLESFQGDGSIYFNPVAVANLSNSDVKSNQFQNSFVLNYRGNNWFSINETVSLQYEGNKLNIFLPYSAIGTDWLESQVNSSLEQNMGNRKLSSRTMFSFFPVSNEVHELTGRAMFQVDQFTSERVQLSSQNGPSISIVDPAVSAPVSRLTSSESETRALGALFSVNYKYRDRYITSLILRADANSKFGSDNRWGLFPSLSVAWRFSEENFLKSFDFLSEGKLRLSYGQSGKQPGSAYARHGIFGTTSPSQYIDGTVVVPLQVQLTNLKWQTIESYNFGLDLMMFNNRLSLTADVYNKLTHDLLWSKYKIPGSSGFSQISWFNGGKVRNIGWEAFMRYTVLKQKDLNVRLNFNISRNRNSFLEFPPNFNNIRGDVVANGVYPRQANLGQPIGSFYGFKYLGVYPTDDDAYARNPNGDIMHDGNGEPIPMTFTDGTVFKGGDAKYKDVNYDGVIDINDAQYLGDSNPEFIGGFGANASWKKFRASLQFMYRVGFEIVNEIAMDTEGMLNRNNQSKAVLNRWRRDGHGSGTDFTLPRAYYLHPANNLGSDRYVEPGDFLRLNNVTFGYSIKNNEFVKRLNIDALEFSINCRKILTFTKYSGQDPEISQRMEDPFWFGTDVGLTPTPRLYSLILNVRF